MRSNSSALLAATLILACGPGTDARTASNRTGAAVDTPHPPASSPRDERGVILFLGTSLTAGYGVGEDRAFPALIQQKIDSVGLPFRVVNAGISGETSAGGRARLDWMLQQPIDVLVLELGANDGLRGYDVATMRDNLDAILRGTRATYPDAAIVITGMEAPPNLGDRYTTRFRETFRSLADDYDTALVPFLLDGVAADPALNLDDGIHPNPRGHEIVAGTVWDVLEPVLAQRMADTG
ncbi:MAG: arylesterase [Longimicrobiales bacterium]